jgi:hypothetical protein
VEYKIKFDQLWTPKYGFCQAGTVGVDAETVHLSGTRVYGLMLMGSLIPLASASNKIVGMWLGFQLKLIPLVVICAATLLILYYRKNLCLTLRFLSKKDSLQTLTETVRRSVSVFQAPGALAARR